MNDDDIFGPGSPMTRSFGFLLAKAAQHLAARGEEALRDLALSTRHVGLLTVIRDRGSMSQRSLGDLLRIDRTTMVALIDQLEAGGLARREPDPADRRAFLITLTPAGKAILPRAWEVIHRVEAEALAGLDEHARESLREWLVQIAKGASK